MANQWFYQTGDTVAGPISKRRLKQLVTNGEIPEDSLVWVNDGKPRSAILIPGLFPLWHVVLVRKRIPKPTKRSVLAFAASIVLHVCLLAAFSWFFLVGDEHYGFEVDGGLADADPLSEAQQLDVQAEPEDPLVAKAEPAPEQVQPKPVPVPVKTAIPSPTVKLPSSSRGAADGDAGAGGGAKGEFGKRIRESGAKTGIVQITLIWNNYNDLDLHCICPSNERVFFSHMKSACGGELDVDRNSGGTAMTRRPIENIYWSRRSAPKGRFVVLVHHFAMHDNAEDTTKFTVRVLVDGVEKVFHGAVSRSSPFMAVECFERQPRGLAKRELPIPRGLQSAGTSLVSAGNARTKVRTRKQQSREDRATVLLEKALQGERQLLRARLQYIIRTYRNTEAAKKAAQRLAVLKREMAKKRR